MDCTLSSVSPACQQDMGDCNGYVTYQAHRPPPLEGGNRVCRTYGRRADDKGRLLGAFSRVVKLNCQGSRVNLSSISLFRNCESHEPCREVTMGSKLPRRQRVLKSQQIKKSLPLEMHKEAYCDAKVRSRKWEPRWQHIKFETCAFNLTISRISKEDSLAIYCSLSGL